jgi:hypothetical protein
MWLFTEFGFFSVVAHRSKPGKVLVRGRVSADVVEFARRAELPSSEVWEDESADYPFRMELPAKAAAKVVAKALESMDYDNFKARVEEKQGLDREQVYMGVWSHLRRHLG